MQKPELLVPAGDLQKLKIGLQYGADAFYLGLAPFSMRSRVNNFTKEDLLEGVRLVRKAGKILYLTLNIYPRNNKLEAFRKHIEFVRDEVKPDALIIADPGVVQMVREIYPEAVIHISVQANAVNYEAVKFWKNQGASRVILPRELTLEEISQIHKKVPDIELEAFVHGAICVSYSGRCLLSMYMTGRDANQGSCAHSCRWKYRLEEEKRPGEYMPIEEDEHGTYIMNSRDMCLLPYLKELVEAGVCSFKIEGRNKTEHYLATVTKAYRKAIEDMMAGREFDESLMDEVRKSANRGFIPGFLFGFPDVTAGPPLQRGKQVSNESIYYEKNAPIQTHKFIGIVRKAGGLGGLKRRDLYGVEVRNRLEKGQEVEVMTPDRQFLISVDEMFDENGEKTDVVHGGAGERILKLAEDLPEGTIIRIAD
ncbi:MAG: U32 family peptidase C-terminal domain-containing protein [Candidatus Peregrinibacteria bacterium]